MRSSRDTSVHQCFQNFRLALATLWIYRIASSFIHVTDGVGQRATVWWHTTEHKCVGCASTYCKRVHDHHFHCRWNRIGMTMCNHNETVTSDSDINTAHFRPLCRGIVRHKPVNHSFCRGLLGLPDLSDSGFCGSVPTQQIPG